MERVRVVSGTFRGRVLLAPKPTGVTRPITDRVKTSLFDRLGAMGLFEGTSVLDVFSGTGGMGIEALSRGAARCTFVERERSAAGLLSKNVEALGLADRARLLRVDALKGRLIEDLHGETFDLVLCDPPYRLTQDEESVRPVAGLARSLSGVSGAGAVLVLRTDSHAPVTAFEGWEGPTTHGYGSMSVHLYERAGLEGSEGNGEVEPSGGG